MRAGPIIFAVAAGLLILDLLASGYAFRTTVAGALGLVHEDRPAEVLAFDATGAVTANERIPFGRALSLGRGDGSRIACWQIAAWGWCDAGWRLVRIVETPAGRPLAQGGE